MLVPLLTYLLRGEDSTVKALVNELLKRLLPTLQEYGPSWWGVVAQRLKQFILEQAKTMQLQVRGIFIPFVKKNFSLIHAPIPDRTWPLGYRLRYDE